MAEDNKLKSEDQPKAASIFNQSGQTVTNQTNVAGDYHDQRVTNTNTLDAAVIEKLFTELNQRIEKWKKGSKRPLRRPPFRD